MLFTDLGASGSSLISTLMLLVSMTLFITTSLLASQLFSLFSLFVTAARSLLGATDDVDDLLVLLALSVLVLSLKLLFTIFDALLLLLLVDDFPFPSPPELLFDSLSSTENANTKIVCFLLVFVQSNPSPSLDLTT